MNYPLKIVIDITFPWIEIHLNCAITEEMIKIVNNTLGVTKAYINPSDKYCINTFYGEAFDKEIIAQIIKEKLTRYIEET